MIDTRAVEEALSMIFAFARIGVKRFGLSRTDGTRQLVPEGYRVGLTVPAMRLSLPHLIPLCWEHAQNLIVRPEEPAGCVLVQLDDLRARQVERARSRALLVVETSPENFQVWMAIEGGDVALVQRLMAGLGSDSRANGAGRLAGSPNCKPKYAPDYPMVLIDGAPGGRVQPDDVTDLLGPSRRFVQAPPSVSTGKGFQGWPDYSFCLEHAWRGEGGKIDRSAADQLWCLCAVQGGYHDEKLLRQKLLEVSEKAREEWDNGNRRYVERTVRYALKREGKGTIGGEF